jgi:hypothetical protein
MSGKRAVAPVIAAISLMACTEPDVTDDGAFEIEAAVSDVIPTVITVEWSMDLDGVDEARVEFGPDDVYGRSAPVDLADGPPYATMLLGNKPSAEVHFRVVAESGEEVTQSEDRSLTTGAVPTDLPELSTEILGSVDDGFIVTSLFAVAPSAVIVDRDGEYVWWYEAPSEDFQVSRARLTADRQHVVFWSVNLSGGAGGASTADQELIRVSLDGTQVDTRSVEDGHHDFTVMPDGGIAYIEYDFRDGEEGDRIIEVNPDGDEREIWSVWDDFDSGGAGGPGTTFSHFNALDYYEDEDAFYVSSLGLESLLKIDRDSGDLQWAMGGDESDFTLDDGSTAFFDKNHQFHRLDDSILMFVNGDEHTNCSDAREYTYDEDGYQAELIWSYSPSPCVYTFSLGDVSRLESGNTLTTFSNQGQIDEVDATGEVVWRLNASLGGALGYATFMEDLYATD